MKVLRHKEIESLEKSALLAKLSENKRALFDENIKKVAAGSDKPHLFSVYRKNIARISNCLRQLELKEV